MEQSLKLKPQKLSLKYKILFDNGLQGALLKWGLIFSFWTALGFINSSQIFLRMKAQGMDHSFWRILAAELLGCWYGYFIYTVVILWLQKKFELELANWKLVLTIHSIAFLILSTLHSITVALSLILIKPYDEMSGSSSFSEMFWGRLASQFHLELVIYAMILGISHAFDYYQKFRERELRASQLESQLSLAQLQVLKMQLHPHFLFNTLNGIAGLVRDQKDKAAVTMIVGLSELLRHTLQNAEKQEVALREELDFLELYLNIQQMRFAERLEIKMNIEPQTLELRVPNLILQPLVENAIRHGISQRVSGGVLDISSRIENGLLHIKIYDDGPGLKRDWSPNEKKGIGLENTRKRLVQLYGEDFQFDLRNVEKGGVEVSLLIPARFETEIA